jgi:hypothetical protein
VSVREDTLIEVIRQFYAERIFGPERAAIIAGSEGLALPLPPARPFRICHNTRSVPDRP